MVPRFSWGPPLFVLDAARSPAAARFPIAARSPAAARLSHWVRGCLWSHGCSGRRRARPPARLGDLTSFGAAPRSPPVPSGPSGALHTSGAWRADVWLGASSRSPARPRRPRLGLYSHRCCAPPMSHAIPPRLFRTMSSQRWNCNAFRHSRSFAQSNRMRLFWGAGMWLRTGVADLSCETAVAFARLCPCGVETGGTFARVYLRRIETLVSFVGRLGGPVETAIAFAGSKWVF